MRQTPIPLLLLLTSLSVFAADRDWTNLNRAVRGKELTIVRRANGTVHGTAPDATDIAVAARTRKETDSTRALLVAWGPVAVLGLAVVDSAGIPLLSGVEIALVLLSTTGAARAYVAAVLAVIGSIAGSLILFFLARKGGEAYLERQCMTPRARRFRGWFHKYGLLTVFIPALLPVVPLPEKIFVASAGALGVSTRAFVLTIAAARIPRYFGIAYLGIKVGENSLVWFERNVITITLFAAVLFAALYAAVNITGRMRARTAAR